MATAKNKSSSARQPSPAKPKQMEKTTSAKTRDMAAKTPKGVESKRMTAQSDAYKKSGASYLNQTKKSAAGDLAGRGKDMNVGFYAYPSYAENGRTSQRAKDQAKRKKK